MPDPHPGLRLGGEPGLLHLPVQAPTTIIQLTP